MIYTNCCAVGTRLSGFRRGSGVDTNSNNYENMFK